MPESLTDIDGQVERVALVVAEITAASEQQADGVAQIDRGVEQANGVTQQVAANAESATSRRRSLSAPRARGREPRAAPRR